MVDKKKNTEDQIKSGKIPNEKTGPAKPSDMVDHDSKSSTQKIPRSNSNSAKKKSDSKMFTTRKLIFVLVLLVMSSVLGIGYGFYKFDIKNKGQVEKIAEIELALNQQSLQVVSLSNVLAEYKRNNDEETQSLLDHIRALEQVQASQNKRLLSMSTTSREDWLLAEVEYLLKLANQRVLIEKNAVAADGLLVEADNILRELDDPDLYALRKAVSSDLVKLRLVNQIDFEGIFLKLSAIIDVIENIPAKPELANLEKESALGNGEGAPTPESLFSKINVGFSRFLASFSQYVKYTNHSEKPTPVLVPEFQQYARLNLQMMLEKAQIALLREQQTLFVASLNEAQTWLVEQFPESAERKTIDKDIEQLKQKNITQALPDITRSLELVRGYLEQLHKLNGVSVEKEE